MHSYTSSIFSLTHLFQTHLYLLKHPFSLLSEVSFCPGLELRLETPPCQVKECQVEHIVTYIVNWTKITNTRSYENKTPFIY